MLFVRISNVSSAIVFFFPMNTSLLVMLESVCTGKKKVKNMHIYMQPLIDELLELHNTGIVAHDSSAPGGRTEFTLKAALLWTIHDWPGMPSAIL